MEFFRIGETGETIRLRGGTKGEVSDGYLEMYADGKWHLICSDENPFDMGAANVACRQLGYDEGAHGYKIGQNNWADRNLDFRDLVLRIQCNGSEPSLPYCRLTEGKFIFKVEVI